MGVATTKSNKSIRIRLLVEPFTLSENGVSQTSSLRGGRKKGEGRGGGQGGGGGEFASLFPFLPIPHRLSTLQNKRFMATATT